MKGRRKEDRCPRSRIWKVLWNSPAGAAPGFALGWALWTFRPHGSLASNQEIRAGLSSGPTAEGGGGSAGWKVDESRRTSLKGPHRPGVGGGGRERQVEEAKAGDPASHLQQGRLREITALRITRILWEPQDNSANVFQMPKRSRNLTHIFNLCNNPAYQAFLSCFSRGETG